MATQESVRRAIEQARADKGRTHRKTRAFIQDQLDPEVLRETARKMPRPSPDLEEAFRLLDAASLYLERYMRESEIYEGEEYDCAHVRLRREMQQVLSQHPLPPLKANI